MNIFGLFKEKERVQMTVHIFSLMNTYLEQCKGDIVLVKGSSELESELKKLENLGLGNSENAKLLRTRLNELENKKKSSQFGQEVFEFMKEIKPLFPNSYLISFNQFYKILKKYTLEVGRINSYTGIIPQKNIDEIQKVRESLEKCGALEYVINRYERDSREGIHNYYLANKLKYRDKDLLPLATEIEKQISSRGRLIKYYYSYYNSAIESVSFGKVIYYNEGLEEYRTERIDDIYVGVKRLEYDSLLIAAPEKCFSEKFEISQIPVDPIVFQCCPYGILVHSIWGEEADDKVLMEYKELNQKILEL